MAVDRAALAAGCFRLASGVSFLVDPIRANRLWGAPPEDPCAGNVRWFARNLNSATRSRRWPPER
jgi:hypothetical protein